MGSLMRYSELNVQHSFVTVGTTRLHYAEAGRGPLVLLLHGFPEMWWCWRYQIEPLARAGYRVVAPDLRGYGGSDKQGPFDIRTLTEDVAGLIGALGEEQAHVVGHDWGGAITWAFAALHPELCLKVAVLNCPHPLQLARALRSRPRQLGRSWYIFAFQLPRLPELALTAGRGRLLRTMYRHSVVDPRHFGDDEIAPIVEAMQAPGAARAAIDYYRQAVRGLVRGGGPAARLPEITAPTLLIWGKHDVALDFQSLVPGTERFVRDLRVETIEEGGHFIQQERPDEVNRLLLAFLKET
jgi:pimeloyl-ACP methyl ester carboxylesterase